MTDVSSPHSARLGIRIKDMAAKSFKEIHGADTEQAKELLNSMSTSLKDLVGLLYRFETSALGSVRGKVKARLKGTRNPHQKPLKSFPRSNKDIDTLSHKDLSELQGLFTAIGTRKPAKMAVVREIVARLDKLIKNKPPPVPSDIPSMGAPTPSPRTVVGDRDYEHPVTLNPDYGANHGDKVPNQDATGGSHFGFTSHSEQYSDASIVKRKVGGDPATGAAQNDGNQGATDGGDPATGAAQNDGNQGATVGENAAKGGGFYSAMLGNEMVTVGERGNTPPGGGGASVSPKPNEVSGGFYSDLAPNTTVDASAQSVEQETPIGINAPANASEQFTTWLDRNYVSWQTELQENTFCVTKYPDGAVGVKVKVNGTEQFHAIESDDENTMKTQINTIMETAMGESSTSVFLSHNKGDDSPPPIQFKPLNTESEA